ncbi:hypothetical protein [Aureimonas sp. AU40]|uniref:hypothetical protein n=1 Tax=Aureimonas sp. AU40 TaxID=1637747 RepID=UPI000783EF5C|nr:hypothetical protein [Aureimonas sp. AU40]
MSDTTLIRTVPPHPQRTMEWYAALALIGWGLVLLQPQSLFQREAFQAFGHVVAENALGWTMLAVGIMRAAALYVNGRWRRTPFFRAAGAMVGSAIWCGLVALFVATDVSVFVQRGGTLSTFFWDYQTSTAIVVYGLLAAFESLSAYRCGKDIVRVSRR